MQLLDCELVVGRVDLRIAAAQLEVGPFDRISLRQTVGELLPLVRLSSVDPPVGCQGPFSREPSLGRPPFQFLEARRGDAADGRLGRYLGVVVEHAHQIGCAGGTRDRAKVVAVREVWAEPLDLQSEDDEAGVRFGHVHIS